MKGRGLDKEHDQKTSQNLLSLTGYSKQSISFKLVKEKQPDRLYYIKDKLYQVNQLFSKQLYSLYYVFVNATCGDIEYLQNIKKIIKPVIASGIAYFIGELITSRIGKCYSETDEYNHIYKFIFGATVLGYSALNRLTDHQIKADARLSVAVASELVSIGYLYASSFKASRIFFKDILSDNYSLIASLGVSGLAVPGMISWLARKYQEHAIKKQYKQGAQRSDTALISAGMTVVANSYFNANYFIATELLPISRLFQLALISDNILHTFTGVQQFRNFPALVADAGPQIVKSLMNQYEKIEKDYKHNTTRQNVIRLKKEGLRIISIERYKLRNNDLVACDNKLDVESVPVSGELVALQCDEKGALTDKMESKKFCVNLKAHNGEDLWIEFKSNIGDNLSQSIDLHAIREGKQAGILPGAKLNLFGANNFFIRIKEEKERVCGHHYEKKAIINQIITNHKCNNVMYAVVSSLALGAIITRDLTFPTKSVNLLFNLFQMMIPFSETFLREMLNKRLMQNLNSNLLEYKVNTIDALRIVDMCNALNGYYSDLFPQGVAIISDKTGTLTTSNMDVLGMWTEDMSSDVTQLIEDQKIQSFLSKEKQTVFFEVFASAYTNHKKELEPEEYAILQYFKAQFQEEKLMKVDSLGNQHFRKKIMLGGKEKIIETMHLGLYRKLGGRLTLVEDNDQNYLVFCGIPRDDKFSNMSLLKSYQQMQARTCVLSRDWCVARASITRNEYHALKELFYSDDREKVEEYIVNRQHILVSFKHLTTFIINNPVKKGADRFISRCQSAKIPVFIATGDTAKNAENIATVLCREYAKHIIVIKANNINQWKDREIEQHTTIIFSGIDSEIIKFFDKLMLKDKKHLPAIIFSEMSTEGKGVLAKHLQAEGYFVVANGDGTNDIAMMRSANMVIAHLAEDGTYAPCVEHLANINDKQLQLLNKSQESFYDLFDIHLPHSHFVKLFTPLANSQEKPSIALTFKASKMSFELMKAIGVTDVKEMWQQHWCSVGFDLVFLAIAYYEMVMSADLPVDNQHLGVSKFPLQCLLTTISLAAMQSLTTYALSGESTNANWMLLMLSFLPIILKNIFNAFGAVEQLPADLKNEASYEPCPTLTSGNAIGLFQQSGCSDIKSEKEPALCFAAGI